MYYKQNEKIMQVKDSTLVVGVDIAKEEHVAQAQDNRGFHYDLHTFSTTKEGFQLFSEWLKKVKTRYEKTEIIIGMEPTGHYWLTLEQNFRDYEDIMLVLVNPSHVKRSKTLDDNSPTKTDKKDARVIAQLVKDGRYSIPIIPEGEYAEMRVGINHREKLKKQLISTSNKVQQNLDKYFPEFTDIFASWNGKAALGILKEIPYPEDIILKSPEEIVKIIKKATKKGIGIKRAKKLKKQALKSVGIKDGLEMARLELKNLIECYQMLTEQLQELEKEIKILLQKIPGAKQMQSIKGVGAMTVAGFISEVGDLRNYEHPRQIQKLAGLNLVENSSGKHKGQTKISKKGRPRLRALLYRVMIPVVAYNTEFNLLHYYYTNRLKNPLKKKQSLIALACKLIRILFVLGRRQVEYDGNKLIKDIQKNQNLLMQKLA